MAKRLERDKRHGVLGGVAAGFGNYLDVDPVLVRLAFVVLTFVHGVGVLLYLACWAIVPVGEAAREGTPAGATTGFEAVRDAGARLAAEVRTAAPDAASAQVAVGSILIVVGAALLAHNLGWLDWPYWARFETLWPLILVALGFGLIARSRRPRTA